MLGDYIMADTTHAQGVYMKQGAAELVVASGGDITVESGGDINAESGGSITVASGGDLTLAAGATFSVNGVAQKSYVGGIHTVTAGEATAGTLDIVTGLTTVTVPMVIVLDTGNNVVTADADITEATGTITVATALGV
jgi:hypothetical protein